jgi:hypothetical protein
MSELDCSNRGNAATSEPKQSRTDMVMLLDGDDEGRSACWTNRIMCVAKDKAGRGDEVVGDGAFARYLEARRRCKSMNEATTAINEAEDSSASMDEDEKNESSNANSFFSTDLESSNVTRVSVKSTSSLMTSFLAFFTHALFAAQVSTSRCKKFTTATSVR